MSSDVPPSVGQANSIEEVLEGLHDRGFNASLFVRPGGRMKCEACRAEFPASDVALLDETRVDVDTDPSDQSLVAGLRCPECNALGTAVFPYGSTMPPEDAEVLKLLKDRRPERKGPGVQPGLARPRA